MPAVFLLGACASTPPAPSSTEVPRISRVSEVLAMPPAPQTLIIHNPFGDINLRVSDEPRLGLHAVIQRLDARPPLRFRTATVNGDFQVLVEAATVDQPARAGRLDLTVFAPRSWALKLDTIDGAVRVRNVVQAIEIRTDSGNIALSAAGDVDVRSRSGDISASLSAIKFTRAASVTTNTGRIALGVPMDASIEIDASAGSTLNQVLGVAPVRETARTARFVLHGGGPLLSVRSETGSVALAPITRQ